MKNSTRQTTKQKTEINNNLEKIYCCYFNNTETIQIVQIKDSFFYFERTVFPSKTVLFEANKESFLEVHTLEIATATLAERICCANLIFQKQNQF